MRAEQNRQRDLVDTTDCLEAVGVFRCWKNLFFVVLFVGLLLLGLCFWIMDLGLVRPDFTEADEQVVTEQPAAEQTGIVSSDTAQVAPVVQQEVDEVKQQVDEAAALVTAEPRLVEEAGEVTGDANAPAVTSETETKKLFELPFKPRQVHVLWSIRALDAIIIMAAILYCLTILFALKISLLGRLGGINHISRAFFWSLILLALVVPWQVALGWGLFGVTFEPGELLRRINEYESTTLFFKGLYWFRYVVVWAIALLCLLLAQIRTARWSRATLKRLEVI
jgi:hypothetical protein